MPNIDEDAKQFELARAGWFGNAVSWRRKALGLTASELARRTSELGYPITRGAIAKIESNLRSGKVDVAEALVLAVALDIPPVLLLFPQFSTDGGGALLPGVVASDDDAVHWMSGQVPFPHAPEGTSLAVEDGPMPTREGLNLIEAVSMLDKALETRISLVHHQHAVKADSAEAATAERMLEKNNDEIAAISRRIHDARQALWGTDSDRSRDDLETEGHD